jgi:hypothetical protein
MWNALWSNYLKGKKTINLTYWIEEFPCTARFNGALRSLTNKGWIVTQALPARNWSDAILCGSKLLEFVSVQELVTIRATKKFNKYLPIFDKAIEPNLAKVNGKVVKNGLVREGFVKSSNTQYYFDTAYLSKYEEAIVANVTKGMSKCRKEYPNMTSDEASYDAVAEGVVKHIVGSPEIYTLGKSYLDSRGRAIHEGLSKVCNPIGFKDFRALLTIPI